ncbi:hypothetical protein ACLOJK_028585 [Asimina triloba]
MRYSSSSAPRAPFPRKILCLLSLSSPNSIDLFRPTSSGTVCGKDIVSTVGDLVYFFSMMTSKKVGHLIPFGEVDVGHPPQPQCEERKPQQSGDIILGTLMLGTSFPEDRVLSNSPDPSGESPNSLVTRPEFHALLEMMKSFQQQMVHARPDTTFVPSAASAGILSPMVAVALALDMAPIAHHPQATSQPHPSSASRVPDVNNPLALHLQMQPIPDEFRISEMAIFGPTSNPTGHVVNYNIYMDLRTTSEGLKCRAFLATLDE